MSLFDIISSSYVGHPRRNVVNLTSIATRPTTPNSTNYYHRSGPSSGLPSLATTIVHWIEVGGYFLAKLTGTSYEIARRRSWCMTTQTMECMPWENRKHRLASRWRGRYVACVIHTPEIRNVHSIICVSRSTPQTLWPQGMCPPSSVWGIVVAYNETS